MKIYLGADHRGFDLKNTLAKYLTKHGYEVEDEGDIRLDPGDDFPEFAGRVAAKILADKDPSSRGILICSNGQGMCMAANRHRGIRAAMGYDVESARSTRNDDNSNVLCLPASTLEKDEANTIVETWLSTPFAAAPRYIRRLKQIDQ